MHSRFELTAGTATVGVHSQGQRTAPYALPLSRLPVPGSHPSYGCERGWPKLPGNGGRFSYSCHWFSWAEDLTIQGPGDLWYFPPGIPHSLQATNDSADGSEFLLVR